MTAKRRSWHYLLDKDYNNIKQLAVMGITQGKIAEFTNRAPATIRRVIESNNIEEYRKATTEYAKKYRNGSPAPEAKEEPSQDRIDSILLSLRDIQAQLETIELKLDTRSIV